MSAALLPTLKSAFGYDTFRPLQEEIITDALAGRDVFALLPTGGGKSLCFQLPALLREGLTIVVSPLIALMKDQVDALNASGIPATFLNSTLDAAESKARFRELHRSGYRLLYVAPERLMLSGFLDVLKGWNIAQFAIDEAHCVSEWGHDFRPEYRQLATLRDHFPGVPVMALTATATDRVRLDIVQHLRLQDPCCYTASFNRPNLTYRVIPKAKPYDQARDFIRSRARECGIVYCASRKATESVAERLSADGIRAKPYHAGLEPEVRARHQEKFLRDEIHVICATIAFGMGINKPNVRYVIHYDLPKNVEGYYQETGRGGRDGLPSECLLLYSPGDAAKQTAFIDEKPDPQEQRIAREQLQQMVHYAEIASCRRASLLAYFSEDYPEENCGSCDNCLAPRETFDGTLAAQKFLSSVYRVRSVTRFGVGLNHHIEILTGARTEKLLKWGHDKISTYGIGKEHSRPEWQSIGRELVRLGLLRQTAEKFSTIELTEEGLAALRSRQPITLTRPLEVPAKTRDRREGAITCDETLFEQLRILRKSLADERDVPAYVVFSDVALRLMARDYPTTDDAFARIAGVGEKKRREFGPAFLAEIASYLGTHPKQVFAEALQPWSGPTSRVSERPTPRSSRPTPSPSSPRKSSPAPAAYTPAPSNSSAPFPEKARATASAIRNPQSAIRNSPGSAIPNSPQESYDQFELGRSLSQIAKARNLPVRTIVEHLATMIASGEPCDPRRFFSTDTQARIETAFAKHGLENLPLIQSALPTLDPDLLIVGRAFVQARLRKM